MNSATKREAGLCVDVAGIADLQDPSGFHDGDDARHAERLLLIVRHVDRRHAERLL